MCGERRAKPPKVWPPLTASFLDDLARRGWRSLIQPDVLVAIAVVGAVALDRHVLDVRLPAGAGTGVEQDRPRPILLNLLIDLPDQLFALREIGFGRLLIEQLLQVLVAVMRVVALGPAGVVLIKGLVGIVDAVSG